MHIIASQLDARNARLAGCETGILGIVMCDCGETRWDRLDVSFHFIDVACRCQDWSRFGKLSQREVRRSHGLRKGAWRSYWNAFLHGGILRMWDMHMHRNSALKLCIIQSTHTQARQRQFACSPKAALKHPISHAVASLVN